MAKTITIRDANGVVCYPRTRIENVQGLPSQLARIKNIISNGTATDGNTELLDIRVDANGIIHSTAGDAVRAITTTQSVIGVDFSNDDNWLRGNVEANGSFSEKTTRISSDYIVVSNLVNDSVIKIVCNRFYTFRATFFNANKEVITSDANTEWHRNNYDATIPEGAYYVRFSMCVDANTDIDLSARSELYIMNNKSSLVPGARNFYDAINWRVKSYYKEGALVSYDSAICCDPITLWPGAVLRTSSQYLNISGVYGARVSFWRDKQWVEDLADVHNKPYIEIPENCNGISLTLFNADIDTDPYVKIFVNKYTHNDELVSLLMTLYDNKLTGKRISILGDSVSTFGGSAEVDPTERISDGAYTYINNRCRYPQANLLTSVNDMWWKRLIDKHGMILGVNESWAGSRVSWDGTEGDDVGANKHIASTTRINHLDINGTPDIIFIYAGGNDVGGNVEIGEFNTEDPRNYTDDEINNLPVATFADAYRTLLIRVQKRYKTSRVVVILPYHSKTYYDSKKLDSYIEVIKEACDYFGIEYIDPRRDGVTMFNISSYMPDSAHYNAKGMELLSIAIDRQLVNLFG